MVRMDKFMKQNNTTLKTALVFSFFNFHSSFATAQECNSAVPATTPNSAFTVHNDGTVTHNTTGLMWKVCSEGQTWNAGDSSCSGSASTHTWQQALQIPQTLNVGGGYAGHSDWRLPNLKELKSIVELQCSYPAINAAVFSNIPAFYWSSSPSAYGGNHAWGVDFASGYGRYDYRNYYNYVRLVRNGQ